MVAGTCSHNDIVTVIEKEGGAKRMAVRNTGVSTLVKISEQPSNEYNPEAASQVLSTAKSYLTHADHLIYSYGGKTFLAGYDLFDSQYGGKGNIDCSTFILLVLAGICYEHSPYNTGSVKNLELHPFVEMQFTCFEQIPERYISIAERLGFPEIEGPKGLDLVKAEELGITEEQIMSRIKGSGLTRKTVELARYFYDRGELFLDPLYRMPGDLVFFQSDSFFRDMNQKKENPLEVTHVGIVSEDVNQMIDSSGFVRKERAVEMKLPAVSISPLFGKRTPVFFARPRWVL